MTIDAMGTQANIAQAIRDKKADYVLAVKNNHPTLADSMRDFFAQFQAASAERTPHSFTSRSRRITAASSIVAATSSINWTACTTPGNGPI